MSSDCIRQIKDRESWLAGVLSRDGDTERELSSLLATAALVRGAVEAVPLPENGEAASRDRCLAMIQGEWEQQRAQPERRRPWPPLLGSWLRVVFTLWRRR
jgi:hypothetical protein